MFPAPFIIAELGVNHDGSLARALELTRAAAAAGADAIKLQLFDPDLLLSRAARLASYQSAAGETDPLAMLRRLQLPLADMAPVIALAHDLRLRAIVTVFSTALVPAAASLPWDAFKTASPDIIHEPLLRALAATGKPLILSTGAAHRAEIDRALSWLRAAAPRTALLHCVSSYPTPPESATLAAIADLRRLFPGPVGYSDHTPLVETGALAVAAGAVILEKHFTLDRTAPGPDHAASLEPADFARYAALARQAFTMLGPPRKTVLPVEADVRRLSRQSLTTTRDLPPGHVLTAADLTVKRPGTGLAPSDLPTVLGRSLAHAVPADSPLTPADLT